MCVKKGCWPAGAGKERVGKHWLKKQNAVLRCSPGCKPGAGCLRGAKSRIYTYIHKPFARCQPCFAAGRFLPAKKNRKKYTLSLKIQHIVCNYKKLKTRNKEEKQ